MNESFKGSCELCALDSERADRSLRAVREDPRYELFDVEANYLLEQDALLYSFLLIAMKNVNREDANALWETSLFVHKLIREARTSTDEIVRLSQDGMNKLTEVPKSYYSRLSLENSINTEHDKSKIIRDAFYPFLEAEPSILSFIQALTEHRTDRDACYLGAAIVVASYRIRQSRID